MEIDPALVRAVQRGEPGAMHALIEASYPYVHRLCLKVVRDPADAADATQEVFMRVMRSVMAFRGESTFTTWLHRVTLNVCATHLRKRGDAQARGTGAGKHAFGAPDSLADVLDEHDLEGRVIELDEASSVAAAIRELSEEERTIVALRDIDGFSTKQAAQILDISESAAKVRLHRAHAKLRQAVGGRT